jgi:hypothetical protein
MLKAIARRRALAGIAACVAAGRAWSAPARLPEEATLMVAGPPGGRADHWAQAISPALGRTLQQAAPLPWQNVGGPDGVTGANQFEARAAPDGSIGLLVPGSAALAWLTGDTRVKFDAARWVPVWAGSSSAALASRVPLGPGRAVRVGVNSVTGPELAALLALDLMGVDVVPIMLEKAGAPPWSRPDVDAVFLQGAGLVAQSDHLAARGWRLMLGFGALNGKGELVRDPAFPELPVAQELIVRPRQDAPLELIAALRAVSAAVQLDVALVLPQLSPAAVVAWWRRGCGAMTQSPEVQAEATRNVTRPIGPQLAGGSTAAITVDVPVLLELRRWLAERYRWRPT